MRTKFSIFNKATFIIWQCDSLPDDAKWESNFCEDINFCGIKEICRLLFLMK